MSEDAIVALPPDAADDPGVAATIAGLVNTVYAESERGLWVSGATRTTPREVAALIRAGEIVTARLAGHLAGVVRLRDLDAATGEFGMLAADPRYRGRGVGRRLVRHAEDASRAAGRRFMQLELLVPRGWTLPSKEFLAAWYTRLGYRLEQVTRIDRAYPHLAPLLATEADLRVYRKPLAPTAETRQSGARSL